MHGAFCQVDYSREKREEGRKEGRLMKRNELDKRDPERINYF